MIFDDRWGKDGEEEDRARDREIKVEGEKKRLRTDGIGNTCVHACISAGT